MSHSVRVILPSHLRAIAKVQGEVRVEVPDEVTQRSVLDKVGSPDLDDGDVADMQHIIVETGALAALEAQIVALTDEAVAAIGVAPITEPSRAELIALAHYVSRRDV